MTSYSEGYIPILAYFEHLILMEAGKLDSLSQAAENVFRDHGIVTNFTRPPYIPVRILSLLYLLFVFPRGFWEDKNKGNQLTNSLRKTEIVMRLSDGNTDDFLRRIRNSIAHGRVEINQEVKTAKFRDVRGKKVVFEKTLSFDDIEKLLVAVGTMMVQFNAATGKQPERDGKSQ